MDDDSMAAAAHDLPWSERAFAAWREKPENLFSAFPIAQGSLADVISMVSALPSLEGVRVSLPRRTERPFTFNSEELPDLIRAMRDSGTQLIGRRPSRTEPLPKRDDPASRVSTSAVLGR